MDELLRFLDLCAAELGGVEAKLELGGADPDDDAIVWARTDAGFRVVVRFTEPPAERADKEERLAALAASFGELEEQTRRSLPRPTLTPARRELDDLLAELATRAGAERAIVIDERSPVVFGDSHDRTSPLDVEDAIYVARTISRSRRDIEAIAEALDARAATPPSGLEEATHLQLEALTRPPPGATRAGQLRLALAILDVREADSERVCVVDGPAPHLSRPFATVYRAMLVFDAPLSEMRADGHLVRALPMIEKKTLNLPPMDPKGGAKIRRLRRP